MSGLDLVHPDDLDIAVLSLLSVQEKEVGLPSRSGSSATTAGGWWS